MLGAENSRTVVPGGRSADVDRFTEPVYWPMYTVLGVRRQSEVYRRRGMPFVTSASSGIVGFVGS
jgi:hypothetical protein